VAGRPGRPTKNAPEVTSDSVLLSTAEATIAQLAQLFETDAKTLPKRLKSIVPRAKRSGYNVYNIREAASMIVRPGYEIEEFIRQMSPQELPPLLNKEFWNAQNARLKYEKELGNYWPTEEVVEYIGLLEGTIRMSLLLTADAVELETGLTDRQRDIIKRIIDGAIKDMKQAIIEKFEETNADEPGIDRTLQLVTDSDDGNILAATDDEEEDLGI